MKEGRGQSISENESLFLDVVRAVSAWAVLIGHYLSFAGHRTIIAGNRIGIESLGLIMFFLLSGYLISATTHRRAAKSSYGFGQFFVDRFARIYVTLVPCMLIVAALDMANHSLPSYGYGDSFTLSAFIGNLLMLQEHPALLALAHYSADVPMIPSFGSDRPLATLASEWWLYMAYGWIVLRLARGTRLNLLEKLATPLMLLAPVLFLTGNLREVLALCWIGGCGIAMVRGVVPMSPRFTRSFCGAVLLIAAAALFVRHLRGIAQYEVDASALILALAFWAGLRLAARGRPIALPGFLKRVLRLAAGSSYAQYALHYPIAAFVIVRFGDTSAAAMVLCAVASQLAAVIVYLLFDRHHRMVANALKSRGRGWWPLRGARRPA